MLWSSAVSRSADLPQAIRECCETIRSRNEGREPDLALLFPSRQHAAGYEEAAATVWETLRPGVMIGCSAGGVIGASREVEHGPGLSLTTAILPDVGVRPFQLPETPSPPESRDEWESLVGVSADQEPSFVLLPDPFRCDAERLVRGLDRVFPGGTQIGGLASGGRSAGENALFLQGERVQGGAVGITLTGNLVLDTLVAQGCRPVGEPMFITRCRDNVLLELDGRGPRDLLQELYGSLEPRDRELFRQTLFLGIVMREAQDRYGHGDFLVRNVMGFDPATGALAVAARLQENQVVQFHVRDALTSAEDLEAILQGYPRAPAPRGAVLFSCLGRGEHLYGEPDHDAGAFRRHLGEVPLGGFFCNGEIGPVGDSTFVHGYTSAFGLFRPRS